MGLIVLDGGMGHLLRRKGVEIKGEPGTLERFLGVALANLRQPELVTEAHEEYLRAGCNVITTNSYACIPGVLGDTPRVLECIQAAGSLARAAADRHAALVAGCLPPLQASYRPDLVGHDLDMEQEYATIVQAIAPYSDVLLCETISSAREAATAVHAAAAVGKPVWVSWTLAEDTSCRLISGETIEEAVAALKLREGGPVQACLFNCCQPESISAAIPRLLACLPSGIHVGAYANGFYTVRPRSIKEAIRSEYRHDMSPEEYARCCYQWVASGAKIVGGCCGIFPEHIAAVVNAPLDDCESDDHVVGKARL